MSTAPGVDQDPPTKIYQTERAHRVQHCKNQIKSVLYLISKYARKQNGDYSFRSSLTNSGSYSAGTDFRNLKMRLETSGGAIDVRGKRKRNILPQYAFTNIY